MSLNETDLAQRLHEVAKELVMPDAPLADDLRRGRRRVLRGRMLVAGAVAFVAVGSGLVAGTLGGKDRASPTGDPATRSSESPTVAESAEPPASLQAFGKELDAVLVQVPGWAIENGPPYPTDYDYAINGPCSGNWSRGASSGGDGGLPGTSLVDGIGSAGFPSEALASIAAARFVEYLTSCDETSWRTQPIGRPGAVLASSDDAVAWIQQSRTDVWVLQVRADGPPPVDVQVQVSEWLVDYIAWQNGWTQP